MNSVSTSHRTTTITEIRAYKCDGPDCHVVSLPWEQKVHQYDTLPKTKRHHYCADHYPYQKCDVCGQRLRPYSARKADWPGTIAKAKSHPPLCTNCYAKGLGEVDMSFKGTEAQAESIRRLFIENGMGDYLWMVSL